MAARKRRPRTYGEGSIYQDKAGRWYFQPPAVNGERQPKQRCLDAADAELAKARFLADLERKRAAGIDPLAGAERLHGWLAWWFDEVKAPTLAETTKAARRMLIRKYLFMLPDVALEKLTTQRVISWVNEIKTHVSVYNVRTALQTLSEALEFAVKDGKILRNVAANVPMPALPEVVQAKADTVLDDAQLLTLLPEFDAERARLVYLTALLGFRRGEGLGLRISDFDAERGVLRVDGQIQTIERDTRRLERLKNRSSRRAVALPPSVAAVIQEQIRAVYARRLKAGAAWQDRGLLFPGPKGEATKPNTIYKWWTYQLARRGLPTMPWHDLRKMAVTRFDVVGVRQIVVKAIVGHSRTADTTDRYTNVSESDMRDAIERAVAALRQVESELRKAE